jgi:hypothetical protein
MEPKYHGKFDLWNNMHSVAGRRMASHRALKLAAQRHGLRKAEYLAKVGMSEEDFLSGKRPAGYEAELKAAKAAHNRRGKP